LNRCRPQRLNEIEIWQPSFQSSSFNRISSAGRVPAAHGE
jgi:hypothetical protein